VSRSPVRVLLVEDNPGDVVLIREMLREQPRARFELTAVARLDAARDALEESGFAVVLLDLSLPDSQGLETFRALRAACARLPVVVLTGLDDEALAVEAVQEGAQDYLVKGQTTGRQLAHALRHALGRHQRLRGLMDALQATEAELEVARRIHQDLLPRESPAVAGYDIFGASLSAGAVGGDLFQYLALPDGALGLAVADVTGHGIGPALLMAAIRSYLRAFAQTEADVGRILTLANRLFARDVTEGYNCTLFLARLDALGRSLGHASAGHHPPGLVVAADGSLKGELYSTGLPLGIQPDAEYFVEGPVSLEAGDVVLLLTDGVVEARCAPRQEFGRERAVAVVRENLGRGAREIVEALFRAVRAFTRDRPQTDDITAVAVKVTPGSGTN
jgi:serine phosphatase RsbU (regulator of sigma subunit)